MEKKIVKTLNADAKMIKVSGQGCKDDCMHYDYYTIKREYFAMIPCFTDTYTYYGVWYNSQWTDWL